MSTKMSQLTYDIKRRIDHFLGKKVNKRIQLYCPMQRLHEKTRSNASDLGILMMDVASKRKQESVDKRIIADIGLFAAELAESGGHEVGHIVLVSGDSDYGYILARLRDKSYIGQIIIFINDYTKETLTQHADHTHCLFQSNLTRKENPFSDYNQRKIPNSHKISSPYHTYQREPPQQHFSLHDHAQYHQPPMTMNGHKQHHQQQKTKQRHGHQQRSRSPATTNGNGSNSSYGNKKILKKEKKEVESANTKKNYIYRRKNNEKDSENDGQQKETSSWNPMVP